MPERERSNQSVFLCLFSCPWASAGTFFILGLPANELIASGTHRGGLLDLDKGESTFLRRAASHSMASRSVLLRHRPSADETCIGLFLYLHRFIKLASPLARSDFLDS